MTLFVTPAKTVPKSNKETSHTADFLTHVKTSVDGDERHPALVLPQGLAAVTSHNPSQEIVLFSKSMGVIT